MDFKITPHTNPIPANILTPQPFAYPSGGSAGGGVTKAELIEVMTSFGSFQAGVIQAQTDRLVTLLQGLISLITTTNTVLSDVKKSVDLATAQAHSDSSALEGQLNLIAGKLAEINNNTAALLGTLNVHVV